MATTGQSTPEVAVVGVYLEGVAKYLLHKLYGPDGPPWGTPLTQIEDLILALQRALSQHCFTLALTQQAQRLPHAGRLCPTCGQPLSFSDPRTRSANTRAGLACWQEPAAHCLDCRRDCFPQSRSLGIDLSEFSPGLLRKVISVGTRCRSFVEADDLLEELLGLALGPKQIERLIHRIGQERVDERDAFTQRFEELPLAEKFAVPPGVLPPDLGVIMTDGGRFQVRSCPQGGVGASDAPASAEATKDEAAPAQKKAGHWREDKIGLLLTMQSKASDRGPCPVIPRTFVDPKRISKLAREIRKQARQGEEAAEPSADPEADAEALEGGDKYEPPKPGSRKVVASRMPWPLFAVVVAAAAWALGFQGAKRKAFVGDGSDNNWEIQRRFFGSFVPILDFIHALSYVYAAAHAGRDRVLGWRLYCRWIKWVWGGQVSQVIEELGVAQAEVGLPEESDGETHPRVIVAEALRYLSNHAEKMKYPEYRKEGLPITSSLVESTVKQINHRVKGTEKFWTEQGAEAILQLRADQLSTDGTLDEFWKRRQQGATGQRTYRRRTRPQAAPRPRPRRRQAPRLASATKSIPD